MLLILVLKHITIKNLKGHTLLEDFNYSLGNTDKVGIIGEEGNGKSTLLKSIYDKKLIEDYAVISGTIDTDFKRIGYFEQQLSSDWDHAVLFEFLLKEHVEDEILPEQYNNLEGIENLCIELGIKNDQLYSDQTIGMLSGGEKVKLQLLKIRMRNPDLLLLDEPTNDLDIPTLECLEKFIQYSKIPIIFISHDETLLQQCANTIIHLEQRNKKTKCVYTIFKGTYEEYQSTRSHSLQKERQEAAFEKRDYQKKKEKLMRSMSAVHDAQNDTVRSPFYAAALKTKMKNLKAQEKRLEETDLHHVDTVEESIDVFFDQIDSVNRCIVDEEFNKITIGDRTLLQYFHLVLYGKDKKAIVGKNGCGKSVLMKQLYEILKNHPNIKLGYMPQVYEDVFSIEDTPVTFLLEEGDQEDVTRARKLLGRMKFTREEMKQSVTELSEGQKAKLYLIRFIKQKCNVLLLDEPTRNLSPLTSSAIRNLLKDYSGCILAISHDRKFIKNVFSSVYLFENKEITELSVEDAINSFSK